METLTKICTKCKIEKPIKDFNIRTDTGKHRSQCKQCVQERSSITSKAYYEKNKKEIIKRTSETQRKNREKYNEYSKKWRSRNIKKSLENCRKWREKNKDYATKHRENNIEKYKEYERRYNSTEKGKINAKNKNSKRREFVKNGSLSNSEIIKLRKKTNKCYWCNSIIVENNFHIDHYTPLSKGGKHDINNIVIACPTCNLKKCSKDPFTYAQQIGRLL